MDLKPVYVYPMVLHIRKTALVFRSQYGAMRDLTNLRREVPLWCKYRIIRLAQKKLISFF